jgi:tripartite-type tricarboxylate transporter receptor subunit TctC
VPYRNPIASINDVAEGRIQVAVLPLGTVLGQAQAGKIRVLAVTSEKRAPTAPDVPTVAEAGFPEFTFGGGLGFFGAKGISHDLRERIAGDVKAVLDESEVQQRIANLGYVPRGTSPAAFETMLEEHTAKWARIATAYGAKSSQ